MASYFIFDYIKCLQRPSRKNEENINLRNKSIKGSAKNVQTFATALRSPQMLSHVSVVGFFFACVLCTQASQVTICSRNTDNVLHELYVTTSNQVCNFS